MAADISDISAEKMSVNFPRKTSGRYGGRRDSKVWRVRTSKVLQESERSSQAQVEELSTPAAANSVHSDPLNIPDKKKGAVRSYYSAVGPLSPQQQKQMERDLWYRGYHSKPGRTFVECGSTIAPQIKVMARAKERHVMLDTLNEEPSHHGRIASLTAFNRDLISKVTNKANS